MFCCGCEEIMGAAAFFQACRVSSAAGVEARLIALDGGVAGVAVGAELGELGGGVAVAELGGGGGAAVAVSGEAVVGVASSAIF